MEQFQELVVVGLVAVALFLSAYAIALDIPSDSAPSAPAADFSASYDRDRAALTFSVDEGTVTEGRVRLYCEDTACAEIRGDGDAVKTGFWAAADDESAASLPLTRGDSVTVLDDGDGTPGVESDDVVRVVWERTPGGESTALDKWTGPDA